MRPLCSPPRAVSAPSPKGFTLVEMIVVLVMVALLMTIAMPSLVSIVVAQRLRAAGSGFVSALYLARSEAIKRNINVTIRPAVADAWGAGWIVVTAGGEQLDRHQAPGSRVRVTSGAGAITYTSSGRLDGFGVTRIEFSDEQAQPGISPRCVIVNTGGLPRIETGVCA